MILDTLHNSQWFTTLDLLSGYWQVKMAESDKEKTVSIRFGSCLLGCATHQHYSAIAGLGTVWPPVVTVYSVP